MDHRGFPVWLLLGALVAVLLIIISRPTPESYRVMQAHFAELAAADATHPPPDVAGATRTALATTRDWLQWLGASVRAWFDGGRSTPPAIPTSAQGPTAPSTPPSGTRPLAEGTTGPVRLTITAIVPTTGGEFQIHGTVTNVGADPITVPIRMFTVVDSDGTPYLADGLEARLLGGQSTALILDVGLPPGRTIAAVRAQWADAPMINLSLQSATARECLSPLTA